MNRRQGPTRPTNSELSLAFRLGRFGRYVWAAPNTLAAIAIGLLLGGRFRWVEGVWEIDGPRIAATLRRLPVPAMAMTLGHAVFGHDRFALRVTRRHERVHVRQYERWGPLFVPLYLGCSVWLYARRRDGYRDNPFEREAFAIDHPDFRSAVRRPDEWT